MKKCAVETVLEQTLGDLRPESETANAYFRGEVPEDLLFSALMERSGQYSLLSRLSFGEWLRLRIIREIDFWKGVDTEQSDFSDPPFKVWVEQLIIEIAHWIGTKWHGPLTIQEVAIPFRRWLVDFFKFKGHKDRRRRILPWEMEVAIPGAPAAPSVDDDDESKKKHKKETATDQKGRSS